MTFQDKEKKRQRGNMNLHSLLFRDLVVSAKVSIRRIKGGNNGIHTFFLIPTSAALPLVFFHYTTATLVFLFCFFYLSLSLSLCTFSRLRNLFPFFRLGLRDRITSL